MQVLTDLRDAGFSPMASLAHDEAVAIAPALADAFAHARPGQVLIVGNQGSLWPRFVRAYRADPALQAAPDPFDTFVEATLAPILGERPVRFAHRRYNDAYLPMQRLAAAARLGVCSQTHLLIHEAVGPWISLRALVGLHPGDARPDTPPPRSGGCRPAHCDRTCVPLFQTASERGAAGTWRDWLAVREACQVGVAWRYCDEQILYHYTHDRRVIGTGVTLETYAELIRR